MWTRDYNFHLMWAVLLIESQEFLAWLERWIGTDAFKKIPAERTRHGSRMMNEFEIAKQHFGGDEADIEITLPRECGIVDDEDRNIDGGTLTLDEYVLSQQSDPHH